TFVDATLLEIVETLPAAVRKKREAERLAHNLHRRTAGTTSWPEADAQGIVSLEQLSKAPPDRPRSLEDLSPQELSLLEIARSGGLRDDMGTKFFDPGGQPNAALRELLGDVRENPAQYEIGTSGEL